MPKKYRDKENYSNCLNAMDENNPFRWNLKSRTRICVISIRQAYQEETMNTEDHFYWSLVAHNRTCHGYRAIIAQYHIAIAKMKYFLAN